MAKIVEREPVEDVEIEYSLAVASKKVKAPRFKRARLLNINKDQIDLGSREAMRAGLHLSLTIHTKRVQELLTVDAEVTGSNRCTVMRQQAFCVTLKYENLDEALRSKIAWTTAQYGKKEAPQRLIREQPAEDEASEEKAPVAVEPEPESLIHGGDVNRPVSLLELIQKLDDFEVTDDLIFAVIEAAEADMDVQVLFPKEVGERAKAEEMADEQIAAAAPIGPAKPIGVHRLSSSTSLHFSESGMPASPASDMFYFSRIPSPESCFAAVLETDAMKADGHPSFESGTVLVFSTTETLASADFAYMKVRGTDVFAQVFLQKDDIVRIRFLNPDRAEEVVKRRDVRVMCKLVGTYRPC
jgi:hypothetical protein